VQRRSRLAQRERRARVGDRSLDLAAVADDARIGEQPLDVAFVEARDARWVEAGERAPEVAALAQDRQPRQAGLEAFEAEPLVDPALVDDRPAPLLVVVALVQLVRGVPAALQPTSTFTTPSTTRTG
jgi:hypothetical protein